MFACSMPALAALWLAGCAGTAYKTPSEAILPEIDLVQVKESSEEALKIARETKLALEAVNARLAEINNRPVSSSGDGSAASSAKLAEIENRLELVAEALKDLQAQVSALQSACAAKQAAAMPATPAAALPGATEYSSYQTALAAFNAKNYAQAQKLFSDIVRQYPNGTYADNCCYWSGECVFALADYAQAVSLFQKVLEFKNSSKADDALLKLGMCYVKTGQPALAKAEFARLIERYPASEYVPRAQKYISEMK